MDNGRINNFEDKFPAVNKAFHVLENRYHAINSASKVKKMYPYQIKTPSSKGIASRTLKQCETQFPSKKIKKCQYVDYMSS